LRLFKIAPPKITLLQVKDKTRSSIIVIRVFKKLFIINFVPNQIYCLAGYWIEEVSPGKFESIFYEKTKQKINEYKNTKKELDEFIQGINLEYKSIKKEINDFF